MKVEEADNRRKAREAEKKTNDNNNNGDLSAQNEADNGGVITPHYTITNQYGVDMADFTQSVTGTPMVCFVYQSEILARLNTTNSPAFNKLMHWIFIQNSKIW